MKSHKFFLIFLLCLFVFISVLGCAETEPKIEGSIGLQFTSNGNGTCIVSGIGTCQDTVIKIPARSPDNETVVAIGENAFSSQQSITAITIPDNITKIGKMAFDGCQNLNLITMGDNIEIIRERAFAGCVSLKSVILPQGVTEIGEAAFSGCKSIEEIVLPDGLIIIGNGAFDYCDSLKSVSFPGTIKTISKRMFVFCENLSSIHIEKGVQEIEDYFLADSNNRLTKISYSGTKEDWEKIQIGEFNTDLRKIKIECSDGSVPEPVIRNERFILSADAIMKAIGDADVFGSSYSAEKHADGSDVHLYYSISEEGSSYPLIVSVFKDDAEPLLECESGESNIVKSLWLLSTDSTNLVRILYACIMAVNPFQNSASIMLDLDNILSECNTAEGYVHNGVKFKVVSNIGLYYLTMSAAA